MKDGIVEPEETAFTIPYKYTYDMTRESRNSIVRIAAQSAVARQLLGN
jgi:hypothetical protein